MALSLYRKEDVTLFRLDAAQLYDAACILARAGVRYRMPNINGAIRVQELTALDIRQGLLPWLSHCAKRDDCVTHALVFYKEGRGGTPFFWNKEWAYAPSYDLAEGHDPLGYQEFLDTVGFNER